LIEIRAKQIHELKFTIKISGTGETFITRLELKILSFDDRRPGDRKHGSSVMTIKTLTAAGLLSSALLLAVAAPSVAAVPKPADAYQNKVATLEQTLERNSIGTRRRVQVDIDRHMAEWLHGQGKDAQALEYLDLAIGRAGQVY